MRFLLISILLLLILTTPLFGQSSKPLEIEKSQQGVLYEKKVNGVWKWFKNANEKTDQKYLGEIRNGLPNGQGICTDLNGEKYVGGLKDWKPDGQGTLTSPNGEMFVGKWKDGKRNGHETLTYSD